MFTAAEIRKYAGIIALVVVYLIADLFLTSREIYFLNVLPLVLMIVILALTRLDILFFIIVFCTPLSIPLINYVRTSPIDFHIPTEPMLFGVMVLLIFKMVKRGYIDEKVLKHPVTYAILFNLVWIFITSMTSTMPLVSFKFLLARLWFLSTFYFLAIYVFRQKKNISTFIWCYAIPMMGVITYSISRHMVFGLFDKQAAHIVMIPFFRDHTSYGAILSMLLFSVAGVSLYRGKNILMKSFFWISLIYILIGLILSYTRAAWASVLASLAILVVILLKIKFRYLLLIGLIVGGYFFTQRFEIQRKLEKNKQDSSADLAEHVKSMSNITTDDSNLERLNRWTAALRMYREKPIFGWGPGTYMFEYAPYQLSSKKTLISTNFGDLGNAHSEYIGPLSESGIPGSLSFILIAVLALITGFKVFYKLKNKRLKIVVMSFILALITYLVHGSLNNFLDTDKASALFWGIIAVFVSLDIYYLPREEFKILKEKAQKVQGSE